MKPNSLELDLRLGRNPCSEISKNQRRKKENFDIKIVIFIAHLDLL